MTSGPTLVPDHPGVETVHMVLDDFGHLGRVWRELAEEQTGEQDILDQFARGDFKRPVKIVAFDLNAGRCRDVTERIARALCERDDLVLEARNFVEHALA